MGQNDELITVNRAVAKREHIADFYGTEADYLIERPGESHESVTRALEAAMPRTVTTIEEIGRAPRADGRLRRWH